MQLSVNITIEVLDHKIAVSLVNVCNSIISEKVDEFHGCDVPILIPVQPVKSTIQIEYLIRTQKLP